MNMISLTCPSCGGTMEVDAGKESIVCPFCGRKTLLQKTDYAKLEYERQMGKARADAERLKMQRQEERKPKLIALGVLLAFVALAAVIMLFTPGNDVYKLTHPIEVDPFENVWLRFSGENGSGRAELANRNGGELQDLTFDVTPETNLRNGDIVTVRPHSLPGYRFLSEEKTFTVWGLVAYVEEMGELREEDLTKLHENTERLIRKDWEEIDETGRLESLEFEPYRLLFFVADDSREDPKNVLYDAYRITAVNSSGKEMIFYAAGKYDNLKYDSAGELTAEYDGLDGKLMFGFDYGFTVSTSFHAWEDPAEMEADLRAVRDGCSLKN